MVYLKEDAQTDFHFALKSNRKVALSREDKLAGRYVPVSTLSPEADVTREIWLAGVDFPLLLVVQVFTNKDKSQGVVSLVTSDTALSASQIQTIYQKRWKVEERHKSVKSNASSARSPTKTVRTQSNPIFACLWAYVKLESLHLKTKGNHFALGGRLYRASLKSSRLRRAQQAAPPQMPGRLFFYSPLPRTTGEQRRVCLRVERATEKICAGTHTSS